MKSQNRKLISSGLFCRGSIWVYVQWHDIHSCGSFTISDDVNRYDLRHYFELYSEKMNMKQNNGRSLTDTYPDFTKFVTLIYRLLSVIVK